METSASSIGASIGFGLLSGCVKAMYTHKKHFKTLGILLPRGCGKSTLAKNLSKKFHHTKKIIFLDIEQDGTAKDEVKRTMSVKNPLSVLKEGELMKQEYTEVVDVDLSTEFNKLPLYKEHLKKLRSQFKRYTIIVLCSSLETLQYLKIKNYFAFAPSPVLSAVIQGSMPESKVMASEYNKLELFKNSKTVHSFDTFDELFQLAVELLELKK